MLPCKARLLCKVWSSAKKEEVVSCKQDGKESSLLFTGGHTHGKWAAETEGQKTRTFKRKLEPEHKAEGSYASEWEHNKQDLSRDSWHFFLFWKRRKTVEPWIIDIPFMFASLREFQVSADASSHAITKEAFVQTLADHHQQQDKPQAAKRFSLVSIIN